ncbi:hypothetical protein [cf. Phormidesmis sp. LEGE 11477]|uniref:hypothetical protein n=1 Tax=cf. Phormidesmis sp. LEGE 11477 TaxID=1828680 RepID=UPI00187E82D3|nr:hypothetical protein [cf. Phormidesmis sp. LEGE 11477]MBE9061763.1 hypothetical protein [cf. Phormidesmis sp. LEGE 11477]
MNTTKLLALTAGITLATANAMAGSAKAATYTLDFRTSADGSSILYNSDGTLLTTQWDSWGLEDITGINNYKERNNIDGGQAKLNIYNTDVYGGNNSVDRDIDLTTGVFNGKSVIDRHGNTKTVKSRNGTLDTGVQKQGGALIIQEESNGGSFRNGVYTADDEARGGDIVFDFKEAVDFRSFSLLDIDDNGGGIMVEGMRSDGSILNIDIDALMAQHHTENGTTEGSATRGTSVTSGGVTMTQVGYLQGDNSMFRFDVDDAYLTDVRFSYPGSGAISGLEWGKVEVPQEVPEPSAIGGLLMLGFIGKRLKQQGDRSTSAEA